MHLLTLVYLREELGLHLLQHGEGDSCRILLVRDAAVDAVAIVRDEVDGEHSALRGVALAGLDERVRVRHELRNGSRVGQQRCMCQRCSTSRVVRVDSESCVDFTFNFLPP